MKTTNINENIELNINNNNLFTVNLLIQSYEEKLPINRLKVFTYKTKKEKIFIEELLKNLENNEEIINIYYLFFSKLQKILSFYKSLSPEFEEEKQKQDTIFFFTLSSLSLLFVGTNDEYNTFSFFQKHIPYLYNFMQEYVDFISYLTNLIENFEVFNQDDFDIIDSIIFQKPNNRLKNLINSFKIDYIIEEINFLNNIYNIINEKIFHINEENEFIDDEDTDIFFISHFPELIFIDNLFIYENLSTNILLSKINKEYKNMLNNFLLIMYFIFLKQDIKNNFLAISIKNKLIQNELFSLNNNYELIEKNDMFLTYFITRFNLKKLKSDFLRFKLKDIIKNKPKSYKNNEELETFFINLIEDISNILVYEAPAKNLKNKNYEEEVKYLSNLILTELKKGEQNGK